MGVKGTSHLTRIEAERLYVELKQETKLRKLAAKAAGFTNAQLERKLEALNDRRVNELTGTTSGGFDNYSIVTRSEDD